MNLWPKLRNVLPTRSRKWIVNGLAICVGGFVVLSVLRNELNYKRKPLSAWLADLQSENTEIRENARNALLAMGERAIPTLVRWLDERDSWLRRKVLKRSLTVSGKRVFPSHDYQRSLAATALGILGPMASNAVPSLVKASQDPSIRVKRVSPHF